MNIILHPLHSMRLALVSALVVATAACVPEGRTGTRLGGGAANQDEVDAGTPPGSADAAPTPPIDAGAPPRDAGATPRPDAGNPTPRPDAGSTSTPDSGVTTPRPDAGVVPRPDGGVLPRANVGITDPARVVNPTSLARLSAGQSVRVPEFNTTVTRLTNRAESGSFASQIYSQLQAFSADFGHMLLAEDGTYSVREFPGMTKLSGVGGNAWNAPRWHPIEPGVVIHYDSNDDPLIRIQETDVRTRMTTTVFTFPPEYNRIRPNQSFDEVSLDGRWIGGMARRTDGEQVIFAVDLESRALGAVLPLTQLYSGECPRDPTYGIVEPDWIGVSPLGRYLVVQWVRDGNARCSGLETYDLTTGRFAGRVYDGHQHGDLGVDTDGSEFFMVFEAYHPSGDASIGVRALPGGNTASAPRYVRTMGWFGEHISCQGVRGECLVSTEGSSSDGWSALEGEVFLQDTRGGVRRLAHHRTSNCGYWVQSRATISFDGRFVLFASDWSLGTGSNGCGADNDGNGDVYMVDLTVP